MSNPERTATEVLWKLLNEMGVEVKLKGAGYTLEAGTVKTNPHPTLELAMVDLIGRLRPRLLPKETK